MDAIETFEEKWVQDGWRVGAGSVWPAQIRVYEKVNSDPENETETEIITISEE